MCDCICVTCVCAGVVVAGDSTGALFILRIVDVMRVAEAQVCVCTYVYLCEMCVCCIHKS